MKRSEHAILVVVVPHDRVLEEIRAHRTAIGRGMRRDRMIDVNTGRVQNL